MMIAPRVPSIHPASRPDYPGGARLSCTTTALHLSLRVRGVGYCKKGDKGHTGWWNCHLYLQSTIDEKERRYAGDMQRKKKQRLTLVSIEGKITRMSPNVLQSNIANTFLILYLTSYASNMIRVWQSTAKFSCQCSNDIKVKWVCSDYYMAEHRDIRLEGNDEKHYLTH